MILKIFSLYDSKAEAYMQPFFMQTKGQAIRAITDTATNKESQIGRHPADFTLFELGEYNDSNGTFQTHEARVNLGTCLEFIKE